MIKKTKFHSYRIGDLAKGCQLCVTGEKTVLFVTGKCSLHCFYCPISDQKKDKDVVYFNEWPSRNLKDLFDEVKLCKSAGVGITGGDPLVALDRTTHFIKALKKRFGRKFHTHLYTPLNLVNHGTLRKLFKAGLDEIRFHLDPYNDRLWERLRYAKDFPWNIGVEVPVIPGLRKNYIRLIEFLYKAEVSFLNLNELEISDTNACHLLEKGFTTKDKLSYGVKGSEELGCELLSYVDKRNKYAKNPFNAHYCTCKLKDAVQLRNRIKRRAKNAAKRFDKIDYDGMLVRGALYYNLESDSEQVLKNLQNLLKSKLSAKHYEIDGKRKRILVPVKFARKHAKALKKLAKVAIVIEYPTHDCLNVETRFL